MSCSRGRTAAGSTRPETPAAELLNTPNQRLCCSGSLTRTPTAQPSRRDIFVRSRRASDLPSMTCWGKSARVVGARALPEHLRRQGQCSRSTTPAVRTATRSARAAGEVLRGALGRGQRRSSEEVRHVGLHAIDGRARDAEIFRDRPEAVALEQQERHAPDAVLAVDESFPCRRTGLRRSRERKGGRVGDECFPRNRAWLPAAQDRQVGQIGRVEVDVAHELQDAGARRGKGGLVVKVAANWVFAHNRSPGEPPPSCGRVRGMTALERALCVRDRRRSV
jgi:hypothetical protein